MQSSSSITDISNDKFEKSNVVASMITGMPVIWSKGKNSIGIHKLIVTLQKCFILNQHALKLDFYPFISKVNDSPESLQMLKI